MRLKILSTFIEGYLTGYPFYKVTFVADDYLETGEEWILEVSQKSRHLDKWERFLSPDVWLSNLKEHPFKDHQLDESVTPRPDPAPRLTKNQLNLL